MTVDTLSDQPVAKSRPAGSGALIVFSGMDSSGKSTQIDLLIKQLRALKREPFVLWSRAGYTANISRFKRLVRFFWRQSNRSANEEEERQYPHRASTLQNGPKRKLYLTLSLLDLIWIYGVQVRLWRWLGRIVICDRYLWDSQVDFRVYFSTDDVEQNVLSKLLTWITPKPDAAFFLLIPVEASIHRSIRKERRHRETPEVLEERRRQYFCVAEETGWPILDGTATASILTVNIRHQIGLALKLDLGQATS